MAELIICADGGGEATVSAPANDGTKPICCDDDGSDCTGFLGDHTAYWPNISSTGWTYGTPGGSLSGGNYTISMTDGTDVINCDAASGSCQ